MFATPRVNWIPVALVLSTAMCIGVTIGLVPALLAINLDARGFDTSLNGLLAAMHGTAGLLVGLIVPRLMMRLGPMRLYVLSVLLASGMSCMFVLSDAVLAWFAIRFAMGAGLGMQWIVSETLMNQVAQGPRRGMIISLYVVVLSIGIAIGPLLLTAVGTKGILPFFTVATLLLASCLPLAFVKAGRENGKEGSTLGLVKSFLRCPSAMLAGAADGFVFQAFMALLPIYFLRLGTPENSAIGMLNAFAVGAIAVQIVMGFLLDRFSPDSLIICSSLLLCVGLVLIADHSMGPLTVWITVALMGGPAAALYTAGLAGVNDAFSAEEMSSGTAAFTVIWHLGGLSGPALVGLAMDTWEPYGFLVTIGAALAVLVVANMRRLWRRPAQKA